MFGRKLILYIFAFAGAASRGALAAPLDSAAPPITVSFSTTYFTNVAASSRAVAAARNLKRSDYVYAPALNINLSEPLGGATFFLTGNAGYDLHQRNSILDRERIGLQGGANARLISCDTTLTGTYARAQSDLTDLSVITTKNTQEVVTAGLATTCNESGRIVPSASVIQTWSDNSALIYKTQAYNSTAVSGSALYKAGSLGNVSLTGQFTRTDYPNRIFFLPVGARSDGYSMYSGGIRYQNDILPNLSLDALVSVESLATDSNAGAGFDGVTYDASLTYHPGARLTVTGSLSRQTMPSNYLNAAYSVAEVYGLAASYRVSARLMATIAANQTKSDFEGAALLPGTDLTAQTLRSFTGSLSYTLSPTLSATLNAGQVQRHANVLGYSYSGAQFGVAISKAF
jgi:hypothetical protein